MGAGLVLGSGSHHRSRLPRASGIFFRCRLVPAPSAVSASSGRGALTGCLFPGLQELIHSCRFLSRVLSAPRRAPASPVSLPYRLTGALPVPRRYDPNCGIGLGGVGVAGLFFCPGPAGCRGRLPISHSRADRLKDPHIRYFVERNPLSHAHGDELCCVAPLSLVQFHRACVSCPWARAAAQVVLSMRQRRAARRRRGPERIAHILSQHETSKFSAHWATSHVLAVSPGSPRACANSAPYRFDAVSGPSCGLSSYVGSRLGAARYRSPLGYSRALSSFPREDAEEPQRVVSRIMLS